MNIRPDGTVIDGCGKPIGTMPALLVGIINRFRKFRGPQNETFINIFLEEFFMGQFKQAYDAFLLSEQEDATKLKSALTELETANGTIGELQQANSELLAQLETAGGEFRTPAGRVLDVEDGPAVDEFINKFGPEESENENVPVPVAPPL